MKAGRLTQKHAGLTALFCRCGGSEPLSSGWRILVVKFAEIQDGRMNFLFHMFLSGSNEELLTGNFMGDFVKGPLADRYPEGIRQGLVLHRKIDSFAQRDVNFQTSRLRLSKDYGLYRGVLVDLFYDHFLANEWHRWSGQQLPEYLSWTRIVIETRRRLMPPRLQGFIPVIFEELLPTYGSVSGIENALFRMSRRVSRTNPLAAGGAELTRHYTELKTDFERFMVAVQNFSTDFVRTETRAARLPGR
jgi:acyl carrier protein phosphodiesterase